jgi:hypothetical protein
LTQRIRPRTSSPGNSGENNLTFFSKDAQVILRLLESTAKNIGLQLRYEPIFENGTPWESDGGLCRILDERLIIINSTAPTEQKCHVILQALQRLSAEGSNIPPVVRQMLENLPTSAA